MKKTMFLGWALALVWLGCGERARADIQSVLDGYDAELRAFSEGLAKVGQGGRQQYYQEHYPKPEKTAEALRRSIGENPADAKVPDAYAWMLVRMRNDLPEGMVDVLKAHHLENPGLAEFVLMGAYTQDAGVAAFIESLAESSPVAQTKAAAAYTLASKLARSNSTEDQAKRERLLEEAKAGIGDLTVRGRPIGTLIDGALFEVKHLGIGKEAPEIEGQDVEGEPFKLSDYRGKVVVIDFWGDW